MTAPRILYRWSKDEYYFEVEAGVSTDLNGPVLVVNDGTMLGLPPEFSGQVPASKENDLVSRLSDWAAKRGYERASTNTPAE